MQMAARGLRTRDEGRPVVFAAQPRVLNILADPDQYQVSCMELTGLLPRVCIFCLQPQLGIFSRSAFRLFAVHDELSASKHHGKGTRLAPRADLSLRKSTTSSCKWTKIKTTRRVRAT